MLMPSAITLISAAFSIDPLASLIDSKQLILFLLVPAVYDIAGAYAEEGNVQVLKALLEGQEAQAWTEASVRQLLTRIPSSVPVGSYEGLLPGPSESSPSSSSSV